MHTLCITILPHVNHLTYVRSYMLQHMHIIMLNAISFVPSVPNSTNVTVTAPNTQIVGQSLILECSVTTVRGITSTIDIQWSIGNTVIQLIEGINSTLSTTSSVSYETTYNITQLTTSDDNRVYQCKVLINTNPLLTTTDNVTLNIIGNNLKLNLFNEITIILSCSA